MTESPVSAQSRHSWAAVQTTAPTSEPLTIEEVKAHCRIDSDAEETLLLGYIAMARARAEKISERQIMPATWKLYFDSFPNVIRPPYPKLQSVTSVEYVNSSGNTATLATTVYGVDTITEPGRIYLKTGQSWPTLYDVPNAVIVTYVAGFGSTNALASAALPRDLKLGMLHYVAHWFENREPVNVGNIVNPIPIMGDDLVRTCWHGWIW